MSALTHQGLAFYSAGMTEFDSVGMFRDRPSFDRAFDINDLTTSPIAEANQIAAILSYNAGAVIIEPDGRANYSLRQIPSQVEKAIVGSECGWICVDKLKLLNGRAAMDNKVRRHAENVIEQSVGKRWLRVTDTRDRK